ncbi:hypothetical protein [Thalassomonas actiniarum]|uniref:Uncharacterized protein n=1 Tax=Thalassomonas actiniarum TaxID=485447 RepID=A0AAE9YRH3_9GAMM|nr:hypothetical protein [Thalassomonas actiniarum]WDD98958.1 hypothetical protein SG35_027665 [Thalassomonas actiniarum]
MKFICNQCQRTIFNRRLEHCEFCGAQIPEQLRLTTQEQEELEDEYLESRRHKGSISREPATRGGDFSSDWCWDE